MAGSPKMRKSIPKSVQTQVLTACRRRCYMCFSLHGDDGHKKGQIAHLDRDPSNNALENLAFLCREHHDEYDTRSQQTKGVTTEEAKTYLRELLDYLAGKSSRKVIPFKPPATQSNVSGDNIIAMGDVYKNQRPIKKNVVRPGPEHISQATGRRIHDLVVELGDIDKSAGKGATYGRWWSKFKKHFQITSYHLLPAEQGDEAIAWLERQKAMQRPKLRRTDHRAWRESYYTAIWARAKQLGLSKEDVYDLAFERLLLKKRVTSLTDLGERNLERLHRIIFSIDSG